MEDLVDAFDRRQVAQPHRAQVTQRYVGRQAPPKQQGRRLRQEYLAAMSDAHDSSSAVDRGAKEIFVATFGDADVYAAPHRKANPVRGGRVGQHPLQLERRAQCPERVFERGKRSVAGGLHERAAIASHRRPEDRIVARQCLAHSLGLLLPKPSTSFDFREKVSDDCRVAIHADASKKARLRAPTLTGLVRGF